VYQKLLYAPEEKQTQIRDEIIRSQDEAGAGNETTDNDAIEPIVNSPAENQSISDKKPNHSSKKSSLPDIQKLDPQNDEQPIQQSLKDQPHVEAKTPSENHTEEFLAPNMVPTSTVTYVPNGAIIEQVKILTLNGKEVNCLINGRTYSYQYIVNFTTDVTNVRFGMLIKTTSGIELGGGVSSSTLAQSIPFIKAGSCYKISFRFNANLNTGNYFLNAGIMGQVNETETYLHRIVDACMFRILPEAGRNITTIVDFGCFPKIDRIS